MAPQLPSSSWSAGVSSSAIIFQLQESVAALMDEGNVNGSSAERSSSDCQTPPSVIGVSPAAVCCQPPVLPPLASPLQAASDCPTSSGRIMVWLQLSAPLPSEGVTLLARYQGGFLDARLKQDDDIYGALIIKVRVFRSTSVYASTDM